MYSEWVWLIAFVWLGGLSFLVWNGRSNAKSNSDVLKSVFQDDEDSGVKFEQLIRKISGISNQVDDLKEKLRETTENDLKHIQRVELLRFNPYEDTGGDQSFTVALLDKNGDGVVITSLHSRSGTRVFAKPVVLGHPEKYEFSKEEESVVKKAMGR